MSFAFMEYELNNYFRSERTEVLRKHQIAKKTTIDLSLWHFENKKHTVSFFAAYISERDILLRISFTRPQQNYEFEHDRLSRFLLSKMLSGKEQDAVLARLG